MDARAEKIKALIMEAAVKVRDDMGNHPSPEEIKAIEPAIATIADYGVRVFDILLGKS